MLTLLTEETVVCPYLLLRNRGLSLIVAHNPAQDVVVIFNDCND